MRNYSVTWYENPDTFMDEAAEHIKPTEVVLDVGCGIRPMGYFRPCLHIMLEPYGEYVEVLRHRHQDDKSVLILSGTAQELLPGFSAASVDSVFLLDVIEHLEKDDGLALLRRAERIAREQVVVFTPLGFMPQHAEKGEPDGWGMGGAHYQEHLSGWLPEEFGEGWSFHLCENFHRIDFRGEELKEPYGAMFAMKSPGAAPCQASPRLAKLAPPLPSEIALERASKALAKAQAELAVVHRIVKHPLARPLRRVVGMLRDR